MKKNRNYKIKNKNYIKTFFINNNNKDKMKSEENKSSSGGTSESERLNFKKKLSSFAYPSMPKKNEELRISLHNNVIITTNLYELIYVDESHKFTLYNLSIFPEIPAKIYLLKRLIFEKISPKLSSSFKNFFW